MEALKPPQRAARIARLKELALDCTKPRDEAWRSEFGMRIPAEPDRDADLVLYWAAEELERCTLPGELVERIKATVLPHSLKSMSWSSQASDLLRDILAWHEGKA